MEWVADSRLGCLPSLMVSTHSPFVFIGLNMNPILLPGVPESGRGVNKSYLSFRYPKKSPTSISRGFFSFNYKVLSIENKALTKPSHLAEKFSACEKALIFIVFMRCLNDEEKVPCYFI